MDMYFQNQLQNKGRQDHVQVCVASGKPAALATHSRVLHSTNNTDQSGIHPFQLPIIIP